MDSWPASTASIMECSRDEPTDVEVVAEVDCDVRQDDHLWRSLVKRLSDMQTIKVAEDLKDEIKKHALDTKPHGPFSSCSTYASGMDLCDMVRFVETRVMEKQRYTWSEFLFDAFVGTVAGVVLFGAIEALHPAVCW